MRFKDISSLTINPMSRAVIITASKQGNATQGTKSLTHHPFQRFSFDDFDVS